MKKIVFLAIIITVALPAVSQNYFENGYFIKNDGSRINCLIKPLDWNKNSVSFKYMIQEGSEVATAEIRDVKEFGYGNSEKFVRATLNIDQSPHAVNRLNHDRNPSFKEETIFLKVLVEGKASLYFTTRETHNKFYYNIDGKNIEQLIYKRYLVTGSKIGYNELYKQQLATDFVCDKIDIKKFNNLKYKIKDITSIFEAYNYCEGSQSINFENIGETSTERQKGDLNLSLKPGITFSGYYIHTDIQKEDFENKVGYRIGLELEYMFPSKRKKWAVFMEANYRTYESTKTIQYKDFFTLDEFTTITVQKNAIDLLIGPRFYFNLSPKSTIFIDASLLVDTNSNSKIISSDENSFDKDLGLETGNSFGLGYRYNQKLSLQFRLNNYLSNFNSSSIVLGYNFL